MDWQRWHYGDGDDDEKGPNMATEGVISLLSHPHDIELGTWQALNIYLIYLETLRKNVHICDTCENMKLDD